MTDSAPPIPSLPRVLLGLVEDAKKESRLAVCLPVVDLEFVANEIIRFDRELARYRAPVSDLELDIFLVVRTSYDAGEERLDLWRSTLDALIEARKEQK